MLKKQFKLRDYQAAFIKNLATAIKTHERIIGCAATGSGKTKTFIQIAANFLNKKTTALFDEPKTVLVITESRKIFKQLQAEVDAIHIKAGSKIKAIAPGAVYIAMAQTLTRRPKLVEQFAALNKSLLVINDEAHITWATKILLALPNCYLIGMTATPIGKHLVKLYRHCVIGPQPHELVLGGYLSQYKHFERQKIDVSELQLDYRGEYTEESQERAFGKKIIYDGLLEDLRTMQYKKCIIYCSSIKHCNTVAETLTANGFKCVVVHSECEDEEASINEYENGLTPICVSVGILTKGYDYPPTDLIILMRALTFKTLALYLQICGRGSRVLDYEINLPIEQRTKKYFTVLDYGQNYSRLGAWDYEREWQTIWRKPEAAKGVPPIKICPQCNYCCSNSAKKCTNCGHEFTSFNIQEQQPQPETILVEVTAKYNKLVGRLISTLNPEELATYAKSKNKKQFAIRVAKWHAQTEPDFIMQFAKQMDYKTTWVRYQLQSLPGEPIEFKDVELK